jgi:hypothetical protein
MDQVEDLLIKVARAGNLLFFFFVIFVAVKASAGMSGDWRFLIIAGTGIFAGMSCGAIALFFRMYDQLESQSGQLKSILSAVRDSAGSLSSINSIAKRVTAPRTPTAE